MVPHWYGDIPFACVLGDRNGVPRKPDPTVALAIARQLDAEPERVLFVGDSSPDIMTAKTPERFPPGFCGVSARSGSCARRARISSRTRRRI